MPTRSPPPRRNRRKRRRLDVERAMQLSIIDPKAGGLAEEVEKDLRPNEANDK